MKFDYSASWIYSFSVSSGTGRLRAEIASFELMCSQNLFRLRGVSSGKVIYTENHTDLFSFFLSHYGNIANAFFFFLKMKASLENVSNMHMGLMISVIIDL